MTIEEYFRKNGIEEKSNDDITPEQRGTSYIEDETEYFDVYFKTGLDTVVEGLDLYMNKLIFDLILQEAKKYQDLFEPRCQSGIFGCYIASMIEGKYGGLDINPFGIKKAKERALVNGLNQNIFVLGDALPYKKEHEAVIGRYVVNGRYFDIEDGMMDLVSRITKNVVIAQSSQSFATAETIQDYKEQFERHGYKFRLVGNPIESNATGATVFVLSATK
jgi:hypothetical protein